MRYFILLLALLAHSGCLLASASVRGPQDFQLHISTNQLNTYCGVAEYNGFALVHCDEAKPSLWSSFGLKTPFGSPPLTDAMDAGTPFNIALRPGTSLPNLQGMMGPYGFSLMYGASSSIKSPWNPNGMPNPMMRSSTANFVFEKAGGLGWNGYEAEGLALKAVGMMVGSPKPELVDGYCTITDIPDIPGFSNLLVCGPGITAEAAVKFKIEVAGSGEKTGVTMFSKKSNTFCGASQDNFIRCDALAKPCCVVRSPGSQASWWSFSVSPEATWPMSPTTDFFLTAWDGTARVPLTYWQRDASTGEVRADKASYLASIGEEYAFNIKFGGEVYGVVEVFLVSQVNGVDMYCTPDAYGKVSCTGTQADADAARDDYLFVMGEVLCPGEMGCY